MNAVSPSLGPSHAQPLGVSPRGRTDPSLTLEPLTCLSDFGGASPSLGSCGTRHSGGCSGVENLPSRCESRAGGQSGSTAVPKTALEPSPALGQGLLWGQSLELNRLLVKGPPVATSSPQPSTTPVLPCPSLSWEKKGSRADSLRSLQKCSLQRAREG
jgi:hypothetical protein